MRSDETAAPKAAARAARTPRSFAIPAAPAARLLDRRAIFLRFDAAFLRRARRLRRDTPLRHVRRCTDQLGKARARIVAILGLVAKAVRLDHEHAFGGEPPVAAREEARTHGLGQRARVRDVEAKLD